MRMIKKSVVVATALFFSMTMIQTNVDAASKKLKINTVYNTTTKVKGKTKKRYKVKLKVGKKTYTAKYRYKHENGYKYLSLYTKSGKFVGYINSKAAKIIK